MDSSSELVKKVVEAVQVLNHDTNSSNRGAANQWLLQFQNSQSVWEVATSLLANTSSISFPPNYNFEAHFFAAQILRRKIKSEGYNLQPGDKTTLLNALLLSAQKFSLGSSQLLTQICLAFSALLLSMGEKEHKTTIEELFSNLEKLQCQENGDISVLELLTVLPEELLDDSNGRVDTTQSSLKSELLRYTHTVMEFLLHQTEQKIDDGLKLHERYRKILKCFLSWIRVDCFDDVEPHSLAQHPLLNFVFNSLQVLRSFDVAIDIMTELIIRYKGLPEIFLSKVEYMQELLLIPALKRRDENIITGLVYLFTEIGHAAPGLIAEGSKEALMLTESILSCVSFASESCEIADSTLPFWCCLGHYIVQLQRPNGKSCSTLEIFQPIFSSLLAALLLRAQVDEEKHCENGKLYIPDNLRYFRSNLEELLGYICQILEANNFVIKIFSHGWPSSLNQSICWKEIESRMLALHLVGETVVETGQPFDFSIILHLVTILSNTKTEGQIGLFSLVYKTTAQLVGSYSKWLVPFLGENLTQMLVFCALGIEKPMSAKACASTFRKLCEAGSFVIHEPQNLEVLSLFIQAMGRTDFEIQEAEEEEIIGAITSVLSQNPNQEIKINSLAQLISPSYSAIQNLIDSNKDQSTRLDPGVHAHNVTLAVRGLSRVGAVFAQLTNNDDTNKSLIKILWPLFDNLLHSNHMDNFLVSCAACRSLSLIIQSSAQQFRVLVPNLLDILSIDFLNYPELECCVKTVSTALKEFGHIEEYANIYITTYERFNLANSINCNTPDTEAYVIEAYNNFASTFITSCPKEVIAASGYLLEFTLQKAVIWSTATHTGVSLSSLAYICCLLDLSLNCMIEKQEGKMNEVTVRLISRFGEAIILNILYCLLGVSPLLRVHKSATILQQLAAFCRLCERTMHNSALSWVSLSHWLHTSVGGFPKQYLKIGEAEMVVPMWLDLLETAAQDYLNSAVSTLDLQEGGMHMRGKGGRMLKKAVRDFAESHRKTPPPNN